jgi:hypothetical protein
MANGERINKPKSQFRQVITDWMTVTRGYKTTVSDMWQGKDASDLDVVASNAESLMGDRIHEGGVYIDCYMCSVSGFLRS